MSQLTLQNKYVIGVHVMWFEIEMFQGYCDALINTLETVENPNNITIVGGNIVLAGNWKTFVNDQGTASTADDVTVTPTFDLVIGYNFEMKVEFPTLYYITQAGEGRFRSALHSSLIIHRIKLSLGQVGHYQTVLDKLGKAAYTQTFEGPVADSYTDSTVVFEPEKTQTVPVYERNVNLGITLKSKHASPATLFSLTWEGDYTNKYYQRV